MPKKALQDSSLSTPELVAAFNALPRQPKARSGMVPNEWHFELRYIQIEPTPSHVVFFVQPHSRFTHMERLPLGLSSDESGMAFFPDTAQQAAPMIAKSILYAFVNNLGMNKMPIPNPPSPTAPWKLTTEDKELAVAVGAELKRIGVKAKELLEVGITNRSAVAVAQESFSSFFDIIKRTTGLTGLVAAAIQTPEVILFHNFTITEKPIRLSSGSLSEEEEKLIEIITEYCSRRSNVMPPDGTDDDGRALLKDTWRGSAGRYGATSDKGRRVPQRGCG
ncbi:hypothetical protein D9613_011189 [Agrocybe pediades]|uniref:Uncharacterized protein n=1 Tax=Agrocybe pediades TaxID=84607 RepID=A0A8H4QL51_9AGAR|nr:hypothetical protein D9613_011189 [Agrocybe pediades]